jgi:serine/threonine protein kinase
MAGTYTDEDFLLYLEDRSYLTALEAESLRTEYRRKKSLDKSLSILSLMIHKGHFTREQAQELYQSWSNGAAAPVVAVPPTPSWRGPAKTGRVTNRVPDSDTLVPESEWVDVADNRAVSRQARATGRIGDPAPDRKPTRQVKEPNGDQRMTTKRATSPKAAVPTNKTGRQTSKVEDSQSSTTSRDTANKGPGWSLYDESDGLSDADKEVAAGTIIAGSQMTIAQVREQMELGEGVKLISNKMDSSLAQFQPDAGADRKRYIVLQEIARGGMGKVLEVEDTELRRSVALKVLRKELLGRRDVVERFLEEAQITGQLEHPNIVPVHEMGVDGAGNLYFTMKLVEGLSLAELLLKLREGNRDVRREYPLMTLLDIFVKICEGMAFAHNRGVIHRDLKPANIMVGRFGEVQVMDWGVAKVVGRDTVREHDSGIVMTDRLDNDQIHTVMGSIIGTPSYMSPEQARGDLEEIGPATDIFSLGVILYEMLCLRSPWTGKTSDDVLEQVREMTPVRPTERNPEVEVPAELERLCLTCLAKDPEDRVETAKELADNIRSFIEGRRMGSVKYSVVRLAMKWMGRHRKEVAGVAVSMILIFGGILGTLWYMRNVDRMRISGLNEDAEIALSKWKEHAEGKQFDKAVEHVDDAREMFYQVLAVEENDERARQGLVTVMETLAEIREMRMKAYMEQYRRQTISDQLAQARKSADAAKTSLNPRVDLMESVRLAQSVLDSDPGNDDANRLIASVCAQLVPRLYNVRDYEVGLIYLELWKATNLESPELAGVSLKYQTRPRR